MADPRHAAAAPTDAGLAFYDILVRHARHAPTRIAFQDDEHRLDYAGLLAEVDRVAALLAGQGARRGERLALWMPNTAAWLVTFLACARLGLTVVAVNTRFKAQEVGQLLERGECSWLALWPAFKGLHFADTLERIAPAVIDRLQGMLVVGDTAPLDGLRRRRPALPVMAYSQGADPATPADPGTAGEPALVYTTSGTTSLPKLVMHRQDGLLRHGRIAADAYGIDAASVVLIAAPLCGAFGFSTFLAGLVPGATMVSLPVFDAATTARQIRQHQVTHTFANNEFIHLLLQAGGQAQPFPSLQYVGYASFAPSLDDLPERARAAGVPIAGLYGSSELQALVAGHRLATDWSHRRVAGGTLACPDARVRAIDEDTGQHLPHGAIGQIEIQAPSLMAGYLDDDAATERAISADGYFRTGDLGYTLDARTFVFQGRAGEHLRLGGFLVNPAEIESFLCAQPGVQAAQVVGAQRAGKTVPVAFVIVQDAPAADEPALIHACRGALASFKIPARIVLVAQFPMVQSANANKIQKPALRQAAQALLDEDAAAAR